MPVSFCFSFSATQLFIICSSKGGRAKCQEHKRLEKNIFCISGVCKRKTGRCKVLRCEKEGFLSVLFPLHISSLLLAASSAQPAKRSSWKHHCTSGLFFFLVSVVKCQTNTSAFLCSSDLTVELHNKPRSANFSSYSLKNLFLFLDSTRVTLH